MAPRELACQGIVVGIANPMTESRVRLPLRIPASLRAKLAELAEREHRSLNKQIEYLLERAIQEETARDSDDEAHRKGEHKKQR